MYAQGDEGGSWNIELRHRLNDKEIIQAMSLFDSLQQVRLKNREDGMH